MWTQPLLKGSAPLGGLIIASPRRQDRKPGPLRKVRGSIRIALFPILHAHLCLILPNPMAFLNAAHELVTAAGDPVQRLHLALELLPIAFRAIPVHRIALVSNVKKCGRTECWPYSNMDRASSRAAAGNCIQACRRPAVCQVWRFIQDT